MNIFVLDEEPGLAARYHNNIHVVKMITESCQILSTAHIQMGGEKHPELYKPTHINHPCTRWASANNENFNWLLNLASALVEEYDMRFGKPNKFLEARKILALFEKRNFINWSAMTPFPIVMPAHYKVDMKYRHWSENAMLSYRRYYAEGKNHLANWGKRGKPDWYNYYEEASTKS